ncbi:MAG TPA: hypothetical protein GXX75_17535 [Clostridiales bacterium]|nr:hypothetical protein [Clostridiales bacterium]
MGLFGRFRKKRKEDTIEEELEFSAVKADLKSGKGTFMEQRPSTEQKTSVKENKEAKKAVRLGTGTERLGYIRDNCEIILEAGQQMEEAKVEYQAVTSYLTDIQKIDLIPLEERGIIEEAARNIYNLTKERNKLQNRNSILSDPQYRLFERYELQIPKELPAIKESESYQVAIEQDLAHLEEERQSLDLEQKDILNKQSFLKGIAIITSIIVLILFLLFAVLSNYTGGNFTLPFLLTVLMGMALALYIILEARKNVADMAMLQLKQNRLIMLVNKVKIKAVNNRNYLEYSYNKYNIESSEQLKTFWEEYVRLKDEARRYRTNTELIEFYNNELIHQLQQSGIKDAEIWIFQTTAILDNKEMVEVRHRLNVRRQKLRERIDINSKQREEALQSIQSTIRTYPDCREEAEKLLRRYRIDLEP